LHVDAITNIKTHNTDGNLFFTSARKDNCTYLWDKRNMSTFSQVYTNNLYNNQRIGLEIFQNYVLLGSESGSILFYDMKSGKK
jgi:hypothetical protein